MRRIVRCHFLRPHLAARVSCVSDFKRMQNACKAVNTRVSASFRLHQLFGTLSNDDATTMRSKRGPALNYTWTDN